MWRENKKYFVMIAFGIVLFWGLMNAHMLIGVIGIGIGFLWPFITGLAIAFVLNVPMRAIERTLSNVKGFSRIKRPAGLIITILFIVGILLFVLFLVIPEVGRTAKLIQQSIPGFMASVQEKANELSAQYPELVTWVSGFQFNWDKIVDTVMDFVKNGAGNMISSTFNVATNIFNGVLNFSLGFIFAAYVLMQKERLSRQVTRVLYAYVKQEKADRIVSICSFSEKTFSGFMSGQCTEAVILGVLCFIGMSIFRFPYALMISVFVAFMSLIPIFGAFISMLVGAFLILIVSPVQAFWFLVFFLALQQLEGNFIYPKVVGNSVGLPAIWVLAAVTVGGSAMGVVGMLINIPICSILYTLLREHVNKRLGEKMMVEEGE